MREAARCFLKAEKVEISANEHNIDLLDDLSKKIAELQPQKIDFPTKKIDLSSKNRFHQKVNFPLVCEIARKMRRGRFPPFGSVFTEFELWEAFIRNKSIF